MLLVRRDVACVSVYINVNKLVQIHEGKRRGIRIVEFRDSPPTTRQIRLEDRSELYVRRRSKSLVRSDNESESERVKEREREREECSLFPVIRTTNAEKFR